jgi:hypothetical protein
LAVSLSGQEITLTNATVHGTNALYVIIDRCVTASPVRLLHVWHAMLYGAVYSTFTAIHFAAGGVTIYPPLDYYEAPGTAVAFLVCLTFLAAPFGHFLMYLLTISRDILWVLWQVHDERHRQISADMELKEEPSASALGIDNPCYQSPVTTV